MDAGQKRLFWDRDADSQGRVLRLDVRLAAQQLFEKTTVLTDRVLGDPADAAEILEGCVSRISYYLDRRQQPLFSQKIEALLFVCFRRALYSRAKRRRREVSLDSIGELAVQRLDLTSSQRQDDQIDLVKLIVRLSKESRAILSLRHAGYDWREVAALLGISVSKAKTTFSRELQRLRGKLSSTRTKRPTNGQQASWQGFDINRSDPDGFVN